MIALDWSQMLLLRRSQKHEPPSQAHDIAMSDDVCCCAADVNAWLFMCSSNRDCLYHLCIAYSLCAGQGLRMAGQ